LRSGAIVYNIWQIGAEFSSMLRLAASCAQGVSIMNTELHGASTSHEMFSCNAAL